MTASVSAQPLRSVRPKSLPSLLVTLTKGRLRAGGIGRWLPLLSTVGFLVCGWLMFTMAGGTWMLYMRTQEVPEQLRGIYDTYGSDFLIFLRIYVALAIVACALTLGPLVSIASGSTRLGARSVERRLAALRLIGLSSGDVTKLCVAESMVYAAVGSVLGWLVYLVSLPVWSNLTIEDADIEAHEMLLPWWGSLIVLAIILGTCLVSAFAGLARVRISPLGVARRSMPKALRFWRVIVFVVLVIGSYLVLPLLLNGTALKESWPFLIVATLLLGVAAGINLVSPYILQVIARICAHVGGAAVLTAFRRIQMDPRATWRRIGPMALTCFIAGMFGISPVFISGDSEEALQRTQEAFNVDLRLGVAITMAIAFIATAVMVMTTAASGVLERAEQTRALHRMGAPQRFMSLTSWIELIVPIFVTLPAIGLGYLMGGGFRGPIEKLTGQPPEVDLTLVGTVFVVGFVLILSAQLLSEPLRRTTLSTMRRRND